MIRWFGALVFERDDDVERVHVPTPVGAVCGYCSTAICPDDRGFLLLKCDVVDGQPVALDDAWHFACLAHAVGLDR